MIQQLKDWERSGEYISFGLSGFRLFIKQLGDQQASADKTLLILHGFPESSYSFHAVTNELSEVFDRIILFDMLGYGLSDKPSKGYSYSLLEQADSALQVWQHFGIKGGHLLAHDMGNSVATELLARHEENKMPVWFSSGLQSLSLTNGSVVLSLAKLRITQKILLSPFGYLLSRMITFGLFNQQIKSAHGNANLPAEEIDLLWAGNLLQNGQRKSYLTIKYINDRKQFEKSRWLPALTKTKLPIHICWGADDSVAHVSMAYYLKEKICPNAHLSIMQNMGHFCQLENPQNWTAHINDFYENVFYRLT